MMGTPLSSSNKIYISIMRANSVPTRHFWNTTANETIEDLITRILNLSPNWERPDFPRAMIALLMTLNTDSSS